MKPTARQQFGNISEGESQSAIWQLDEILARRDLAIDSDGRIRKRTNSARNIGIGPRLALAFAIREAIADAMNKQGGDND